MAARNAFSDSPDEADWSRALFREMLASTDAAETAATQGAIAPCIDVASVVDWLAAQMLTNGPHSVRAKFAKGLLIRLHSQGPTPERRAAERALIWMALHTRPVDRLSRAQRKLLLPKPQLYGANWALSFLDKHYIRPLLNEYKWKRRRELAQSKFGFDFADDGTHHLWERIEKYKADGKGFAAWIAVVLENHWHTLHRRWKPLVAKYSEVAEELDQLASVQGDRRLAQATSEQNGAPPPFAASDPWAASRLTRPCRKLISPSSTAGCLWTVCYSDWRLGSGVKSLGHCGRIG